MWTRRFHEIRELKSWESSRSEEIFWSENDFRRRVTFGVDQFLVAEGGSQEERPE